MDGEGALSNKLRVLSLELETLQQHGHKYIEGQLTGDWLTRLEAGEESKPKDFDASVKSESEQSPARLETGVKSNPAYPSTNMKQKLSDIEREVETCALCDLAKTRTNAVFGVGDPKAKLMFIGEAPGADEDRKGEPFVGRAGRLLTDMIKAMGFERGDVYIANILKCRPPGNRDPLPAEVEACEKYLIRQIKAIDPVLICALGAVSAKTLLKTKTPIGRLRGEFHSYQGTPLLATFHPAYLLRNPPMKTEAWKDIKMLMKKLGMPIPAKEK